MTISRVRVRRFFSTSILCVFAVIVHAADAEDVFWDSVVKGNAQEEYELYLKQYPKGRHAQEARQKLEALQTKVRAQHDAKKQKPVQVESARRTEEEFRQNEEKIRRLESQLRQREEADAKRQRNEQEAERKRAENASMRPRQVFRDCADCPDMVVIPAGSFEMGSNNGDADERPVHNVTIGRPFAMAKTEVTQAQWRTVMGSNPSRFSGCDECPVENVSWNDVQDFIREFSQKSGKNYRLPSEAEWEYACRAGGAHNYCGGDGTWYLENSGGRTHAVASKQPNGWGLYDMSGNVWEWTEDCWNTSYNGAPTDGSAWASGNCVARVLRGGSWSNYVGRASMRIWYRTTNRYSDSGFRLARMLP